MAGIIVYPLFTLATVPNGGTGATSFTSNGVLYGNGTAALQVTAQGTANSILTANAGAPSFSQTPVIQTSMTIGVAGSATGRLLLRGTTSGTVTATVAAAAGTWTLTLPTGAGTANFVMATDGAGIASWISGQTIAGLTTSSTPQFARAGFGAAADAARPLLSTSSTQAQAVFYGYSVVQLAADTSGGAIQLGNTDADAGRIDYSSAGNTAFTFDNTYNSVNAVTQFRMRTAGTPVVAVTILGNGNVGFGTSTFGTSAATVFAIANGTAPTTGPADTVQFYSSDNAAGNTIPSFYCEGTDVLATGQADSTSSVRVKMRINGTVVTLLAI